jgi:hypothetical protein
MVILIPMGDVTGHDFARQSAADTFPEVRARQTPQKKPSNGSLAIRAAHQHLRHCERNPSAIRREGFQNPVVMVSS